MIAAARHPVSPHCTGAEAGLHAGLGPDGLELEGERATAEEGGPPAAGGVRPPARAVFGEDDRERVGNTRNYPWRAICHLRILAADGEELFGTGWLAAPRLVATAGHCIFDPEHGGLAREIEVFPGRDGESSPPPFGSFLCSPTEFRVDPGWRDRRDRGFDFGALVAPAPALGQPTVGDRLGFFGLAVAATAELAAASLNLAGYPKETNKELGSLWWHARTLSDVQPRRLLYHLDTRGGQSGSPIWRRNGDARQVVGIHTGDRLVSNQGVRLTRHVFDTLLTWARQAA